MNAKKIVPNTGMWISYLGGHVQRPGSHVKPEDLLNYTTPYFFYLSKLFSHTRILIFVYLLRIVILLCHFVLPTSIFFFARESWLI